MQKEANTSGNRTILVAEFDRQLGRAIAHRLEQLGHDAHLVADGVSAINHIFLHRPDLVLVNQILPRLDARQICAMMRGNDRVRHTPVIVVSPPPRTEMVSAPRFFEQGVHHYVTARLSMDDLMDCAETVLRQIHVASIPQETVRALHSRPYLRLPVRLATAAS